MGGIWQTLMQGLCSSAVDAVLSDAMIFAARNIMSMLTLDF